MSDSLAIRSEHGALPLAPIDRPRGLFLRLVYAVARRRYGKVPTAFRVLYARAPLLGFTSMVIYSVLDRGLSLDRELRFLLQVAVSKSSNCTFCADIALAEIARTKIGAERFRELSDFERASQFSEREKAALAYVHGLSESLAIDDAVWARLARSFSEREQTEIVWVCAVERYFNSMALPLRIGSDELAPR
jgi:alkylhydroperoxidase family enzyme